MRSKIGNRLLFIVAFVLVLSLASVAFLARRMIIDFGDYSASVNKASIRDHAKVFMSKITHEQAMGYDNFFNNLAASSALVAGQAAWLADPQARFKAPVPADALNMAIHPENKIFSNDATADTMVLFWGGPILSAEADAQIRALAPIDPLLGAVKEKFAEVTACYVVTEMGVARYFPNIHGVEKLPPVSEFDIRQAAWYVIAKPGKNPERQTVWSSIYLDSVGHGLLTTAATPIFSKTGTFLLHM